MPKLYVALIHYPVVDKNGEIIASAVTNLDFDTENDYPITIATCARKYPTNISYEKFRAMLNNGKPYVLTLGTAWGLAEEFISKTDYVLDPIAGTADYNHLSVRSAAAMVAFVLLV
jgi:hypothetical protein